MAILVFACVCYLMAISPILEKAYQGGAALGEVLPYLFVTFVWGYSLLFPSLKDIIPQPTGLTVTSFMMMLGVYLAARVIRLYKIVQRVSFWIAAVCSAVLVILIAFSGNYFCNNLCLVAFVLVVMLFSAFEKIKLPPIAQKIVLAVAPSMFGVYVVHGLLVIPSGSKCIGGMMKDVYAAFSHYGVIAYFVSAAVVFGCALLVDFGRRLFLRLAKPLVVKVNDFLDGSYEKYVDRFDHLMRAQEKE